MKTPKKFVTKTTILICAFQLNSKSNISQYFLLTSFYQDLRSSQWHQAYDNLRSEGKFSHKSVLQIPRQSPVLLLAEILFVSLCVMTLYTVGLLWSDKAHTRRSSSNVLR